MKIKIEIDVPEYIGGTYCRDCPLEKYSNLCFMAMEMCKAVDFSRMTIKELEETKCSET